MIRPVTFVTMMLAALSGAYLFGVKHRAQVLDDRLAAMTQESRLDEQRIRVLQAQWALEIDPNRLSQLSGRFTHLQPMKPVQLVTLGALGEKLPKAGSAAPGENPVAVQAPAAIAQVVAPAAQPVEPAARRVLAVADALPLPPPPPPSLQAAVVRAGPAKLVLASAKIGVARRRGEVAERPALRSHLAESVVAENLPPPRPVYGAVPGGPVGARVETVSAVPSAVDDGQGGSLLGMATDMAPPQPLSQGTSN